MKWSYEGGGYGCNNLFYSLGVGTLTRSGFHHGRLLPCVQIPKSYAAVYGARHGLFVRGIKEMRSKIGTSTLNVLRKEKSKNDLQNDLQNDAQNDLQNDAQNDLQNNTQDDLQNDLQNEEHVIFKLRQTLGKSCNNKMIGMQQSYIPKTNAFYNIYNSCVRTFPLVERPDAEHTQSVALQRVNRR